MTKNNHDQRFYLPELDGLRFLAFFFVFLSHAPLAAAYMEPTSFLTRLLEKCHNYGWIGVDLFLCLSSFLITRLFLLEWEKKGSISVIRFYIRRALRIWPLYFLACALGFLIFPLLGVFGPAYGTQSHGVLVHQYLVPYLAFLANWATAVHGYAQSYSLALLWTISLEEQFYIIFPLILLMVGFRTVVFLRLSALLILLTILVRAAMLMMGAKHPAIWVTLFSRLDPFVLGGVTALLLPGIKLMKSRTGLSSAFFLFGLVCISLVIWKPEFDQISVNILWQYLLNAMGCCSLIAAATFPGAFQRAVSIPWIVQLGKISYGLYVYHVVALAVAHQLTHRLQTHFGWVFGRPAVWITETGLGLILTIGVSVLSYRFFEMQFLKLKEKFTTIKSRPI